jgi:hypothetical protein
LVKNGQQTVIGNTYHVCACIIISNPIFSSLRLKIAIELIEEGSIAVGDIMSTLFFPLVPFVFQLVWLFFFIAVAMYLASSGVQKFVLSPTGERNCPEAGKSKFKT